jgi:hypothetical protein
LARTRRPGADVNKKCVYYHINAESTIDMAITQALITKKDVIDGIMNDLKNYRMAA